MIFKKTVTQFFLSILMATVGLASFFAEPVLAHQAGSIPIQHEGRIKSLDVFARESVQIITGKDTWQRKPALTFMLNLLDQPDKILNVPCIRVDYIALKKLLSLSQEKKYFSFNEIKKSFPLITTLMDNARVRSDQGLKPSILDQKVERLYQQLMMVSVIATGEVIRVIPPKKGTTWLSPYTHNKEPLSGKFMEIAQVYQQGDINNFANHVNQWNAEINLLSKDALKAPIKLEIYYYKIKPFYYSWILYLLAFLFIAFGGKRVILGLMGKIILCGGFAFQTVGLVLRFMILGHPPVSNMYESMLFMDWTVMICAFIFFIMMRKNFFLTAGALTSALVMIYANLLPIDQSMDVLVPVLRSNYWLTLHVMTIVSSYGILGLAMALGHRHLFFDVMKKFSPKEERSSIYIITRLLQTGLIALGIGTVLGGVWANESWGRFWGWDPKETWALITFLGYMAILHFRYTGKLNNFWLASFSIWGFFLVLMTWYGVNFILGKGLHSYGSGAGGTVWLVYYALFEIFFMMFVVIKRRLKT